MLDYKCLILNFISKKRYNIKQKLKRYVLMLNW